MKMWTVEEMLAENPCSFYTYLKLKELWKEKEKVSLLDIFEFPISNKDKMWCVWRKNALTKNEIKILLDKIVERAITNHVLNCGIKEVENWGQKWLSGNREAREVRAAEAAWEAAWEAAREAWAARAAARAARAAWAARAAARAARAAEAAWAAWAAEAAWAAWAAWAAARAAERAWEAAAEDEYLLQIANVKEIIKR